MRAITVQLSAGLFALALGALSAASCADALHLDPPGDTGGGPSEDGGTHECRSNPDCAYPTAICDTIAHRCVECLTYSDCGAKPGTVCSKGSCGCPTATDTYCADTQTCIDTQTSSANCGECGRACFGACVMGKCADKWEPLPAKDAPAARSHHVAVWTGTQMFVWGGVASGAFLDNGALYNPSTRKWTSVSTVNAPSPRYDATAVWDDVHKVVVVWGGQGPSGPLATGGRYDPAKDAWLPTNTTGAPSARSGHTAVWATPLGGFPGTSAGMIVWGGNDKTGHVGDGAVYDPVNDSWVGAVDPTAAPSARAAHAAVWDGTRMIVYGGYGFTGTTDNTVLGDAYVYNPALTGMGAWGALSSLNAPSSRYSHSASYDAASSKTAVFGGYDGTSYLGDGAVLLNGVWSPLGSGPEPRVGHSAVVVGSRLIVFGGDQGAGAILGSGWSVDLSGTTYTWSALPAAPAARTHHTAVVAGTSMIIWGGDTPGGPTNSGATYDASP
jgi:hypothetical protein